MSAGLQDGLAGKPKVEAGQYNPMIKELAQKRATATAEIEKKEAAAFLEKIGKEKGAEKTASGLIFIPVKAGSGAAPKPTDTVKVHYKGTLRDGSVFDSSIDRGQPATFPLNRVVPCWTEGLQKMQVGGKARLACPEPGVRRPRRTPEDQAGFRAALRGRTAEYRSAPRPGSGRIGPFAVHRTRRQTGRLAPRTSLIDGACPGRPA